MNLILQTKAGELHLDEVFKRNQADTVENMRLAERRHGIRIFGADTLAGENHSDGAAGGGRFNFDEHVDSRRVTILKANGSHYMGDPFEIFAVHDDIDVLRESAGVRFAVFDIQISGEAADDPVVNSGS